MGICFGWKWTWLKGPAFGSSGNFEAGTFKTWLTPACRSLHYKSSLWSRQINCLDYNFWILVAIGYKHQATMKSTTPTSSVSSLNVTSVSPRFCSLMLHSNGGVLEISGGIKAYIWSWIFCKTCSMCPCFTHSCDYISGQIVTTSWCSCRSKPSTDMVQRHVQDGVPGLPTWRYL